MTNRNAMIACLHQRKAKMGLDDETYRAKLEQLTGKRSAADLTDTELSLCLNNFHVKQSAHVPPHHAKIKALYIAAFNLGAVLDGSDEALDAFVARQTGKLRLTFVAPGEAAAVTEALKAMLAREGLMLPAGDRDGMEARRALLEAQWAKLHHLGAVQIADKNALENWAEKRFAHCHCALVNYKRQDLDAAARELGRWLRRTIANRKARAA